MKRREKLPGCVTHCAKEIPFQLPRFLLNMLSFIKTYAFGIAVKRCVDLCVARVRLDTVQEEKINDLRCDRTMR